MTDDINPADLIPQEDIIYTWKDSLGNYHEDFDSELALAYLPLKGHILVNSRWARKEDKEDIVLYVICNDIFAWACADTQDLPRQQLRALYERVRQDPKWGAAKWCIEQRGEMPQSPVEAAIKKAGLWDIDEEKLKPNTADKQAQAVFTETKKKNDRRVIHPRDLTKSQREALRNAKVPAGSEAPETLMQDD